MVDYRSRWEVVHGMSSARQRGHGCVSTYLRQVGVPRSTGYRWAKKLHWLVEFGPGELGRLRAECGRLRAEVARRGEERTAVAPPSRAPWACSACPSSCWPPAGARMAPRYSGLRQAAHNSYDLDGIVRFAAVWGAFGWDRG